MSLTQLAIFAVIIFVLARLMPLLVRSSDHSGSGSISAYQPSPPPTKMVQMDEEHVVDTQQIGPRPDAVTVEQVLPPLTVFPDDGGWMVEQMAHQARAAQRLRPIPRFIHDDTLPAGMFGPSTKREEEPQATAPKNA